ncbi:S41 family peptidase [Anaerotignum sp.]
MKRKDFWKGFGAALVLAVVLAVAWKPICRMIPWHLLPFEISMSREAKVDIIQSYLDKYYVDDLNEEQVEEMLYAGMMAGVGDRYTYYLTEENLNQYMENSNGNFDGVGIEVYGTQEGEVVISSVMAGQPAEAAGMKAGDVIIGVDGENMQGKMLSDVAAKIRGKEGTEVTIQVLRRSTDETLEFTMKRATVVLESVSSCMMDGKIGYISISGFKENTYTQFKEALDGLQAAGMKGLILDLRDNPGGLVRSVYEIGEELLPEGTMVYTLDKKGNRNDLKCDGEYLDIPMVVLVNANSASASEIFAGAVKDTGRGTLIGTQTFGKGLVQRLFTLPDGSGLNITIQKYYTPSGTSIHGVGIEPDEVVELPAEYQNTALTEIPEEADTQLQKGIEVLRSEIG